MFVLSFSNAAAQDSVKVKTAVKESFEKTFQGASKVRFEPFKGIYRVKFDYLGGHWLAFYQPSGALITKGRLVPSDDHLPIAVQTGLYDAKRRADALHEAADELPALGTRRSGRGEEEVPHNHGGSHPNTPRDDVQQP